MILSQNISMKRAADSRSRRAYIGIKHIVFIAILLSGIGHASVLKASETDSLQYVKGIVRDAKTKAPIVAAQIKALNYNASATTNINGEFSIKLKNTTELLLVTAFDYNPREIAVRGKESLAIDLYPDVFKYGYEDKIGVAGTKRSSYTVKSSQVLNDIEKQAFVSLDQILQTELGGEIRSVSRSGDLGMGNAMFIRGLNSIHANAQPLLVVDGVIWNSMNDLTSLHDGYTFNALADINVDDIESVSVLKDGTSIYGSKGSNGVILINTKRGKDIVTKIVVNASGGVMDMPETLPMLNKDEFRLYTTDLLGSIDKNDVEDIFGQTINELDFLNEDRSSSVYNKYHNNTNWDDEVYNYGSYQNYNVGVNGGDDKALYGFSVGYTGIKGVVKATDMQRFNVRFNADVNFTEAIKMGMDIGYTNIDRVVLDDGVNDYSSVTYLGMIKSPFVSPNTFTQSGTQTDLFSDSDVFGVGNPSAIIDDVYNTNKHYRLNVAVSPKFKISPDLSINTKFDYSLWKEKESFFAPQVGVKDVYLEGLGVSNNVYKSQVNRNIAIFGDAYLNYRKTFDHLHRINGLLGWRYMYNDFENEYGEGHNSSYAKLVDGQQYKKSDGINETSRSISTYGNLEYSYDNRFFVTGSVSVDGSSKFGVETKGGFQLFDKSWGVFPSLQGAWLVSSEKFMANVNFIDRLKIRGGVGITGNDDLDPYTWASYFTSVPYVQKVNGIVLSHIGNTEIQWETTTKLNAGVDLNLFNDRLALSVDAYQSKTKDLLMYKELPEIIGTGYYWANEGELSNIGMELAANVKVLNAENLKFELGASVGQYKNEIESLPSGEFTTNVYGAEVLTSEGEASGVFYGYRSLGVFNTADEASMASLKQVDEDGTESFFGAGDIHFADVNNDGIINEKDKQVIGDPNPDFYGSFDAGISYKNLKIDGLFTFSYGNDVYNYLRANLEGSSEFYNQTTAVVNRWTYDGQQTEQPKATYGDPMGNARFSDRWIEDGSYLKLKKVTVSYEVPIKGTGAIKGLNIWAAAHNLVTWTDYLGRDPEFSAGNSVLYQGIDRGLLPSSRSYFVGIKLNL